MSWRMERRSGGGTSGRSARRLRVRGPRGARCMGGDRRDAVLREQPRRSWKCWCGSTIRLGGGFFDTEAVAKGERRLGALTTRRKPLQDSPTPAGNPVAAALLLRLEALNGREDYSVKALETLETFAGVVEHFGLYAASYGLALQRMVQRAAQVCVIGDDAAARRLEAVALARYAVNKSVIRLQAGSVGGIASDAGGDSAASSWIEG